MTTDNNQTPILTAELRPAELRREFVLFTHYIIRQKPLDNYLLRYIAACQKLLAECPPSKALPLLDERPWLLGPLDAACGLLRPQDELRQKLLIASAVLEAGPDYAPHFLPRRLSVPRLFLTFAWCGIRWLLKLLVGTVVLLILLDRWQAQQTQPEVERS